MPGPIDMAFLLMDGTVLAQQAFGANWWRLTPDATGSYANGTWTSAATMHYARFAYGSTMLRDGRLFVAGGEHGDDGALATAEIFDPRANTWTLIPSFDPAQFNNSDIADSTALSLADGRVLLFLREANRAVIYDPCSGAWTPTSPKLDGDFWNDEESVAALPDNTYVQSNIWAAGSQKYVAGLDRWVDTGAVPATLSPVASNHETGPATLLYDGRVLFLGAGSQNALYTPPSASPLDPGSWQAAPDLPAGMNADDVPAAVMPNGHVLIAVNEATGVSGVLEYQPESNAFAIVPEPAAYHDTGGSQRRMLLLPTGEVFFPNETGTASLYMPTSGPDPRWKPRIVSVTDHMDGSYLLSGTQLNGFTGGAYFGDDAQSATNYPVVRLTDAVGAVHYGRAYDPTSMGIGTHAGSVSFTAPGLIPGSYSVQVVVNGIASDPYPLTLSPSSANCSDGVWNGDETSVDCGGSCSPCALSCSYGSKPASSANWVASPDYNGDGYSDVVTTTTNQVHVHLGGPTSTGAEQVLLAPPHGETGFGSSVQDLGDVNGDGIADLGVAATSLTGRVVHVYLGSRTGISPTPSQTLTAPDPNGDFGVGLRGAGDVDGDGYADVIVGDDKAQATNTSSGIVYLYRGSASGVATTPIVIQAPFPSVQRFGLLSMGVGDINGDGNADVVVGSQSAGDFVFLGNRAAGLSFSASLAGPSATTGAFAFGDVNGDGLSDFVVSSNLYYGQRSAPGFASNPVPLPIDANRALIADFDGDGYADLLGSQMPAGTEIMSVYKGGPAGLSTAPVATLNDPYGTFNGKLFGVGDFNGDGYADAAVWSGGMRSVLVYTGGPSGLGPSPAQSPILTRRPTVAQDFNGDGLVDVLQSSIGKVHVLYGASAGFAEAHATILSAPNAGETGFGRLVVDVGDINGDGIADVGVTGSLAGTNYVHVYFGATAGVPASPAATISGSSGDLAFGGLVAAAGDVNDDGYGDVLVSDQGYNCAQSGCQGAVYLYYGSSTGLAATRVTLTTANASAFGAVAAGVGDVNGDGYDDVAAGGGSNGVALFLGGPSGPSSASGTLPGAPVATGDLNDDNASDFVVGQTVYVGRATSPFYAASTTLTSIGDVRFDDINRDGFDDLLALRTDRPAIDVYLGSAAGLSATATEVTLPGSGLVPRFAVLGHASNPPWDDAFVWLGNPASQSARLLGFGGSSSGLSAAPLQNVAPNLPWYLAPDFNGDGYPDLFTSIRGGPGAPVPVYYGSAAGFPSTPSVTLPMPANNPYFGRVVANLGDMNHDGIADFGVSSYQNVFVFLGATSGLPTTTTLVEGGGSFLGWPLSGAGDINGDGFDDMLAADTGYGCGESFCAGAIYGYAGSASGTAKAASWLTFGTGTQQNFGMATLPLGDVDGDGYDDIAVETGDDYAVNFTSFLYRGGSKGFGSNPTATLAGFPSAAGDLNADGLSDLVIGSQVFYGPALSTATAVPKSGAAYVADFNGDGVGDLLLAQGATISMLPGPSLSSPAWTLTVPGGQAASFAEVGDFDQDGWLDAAIWAGDLYVYKGSPTGFAASPAQTFVYNNGLLVPGP